MATPQGIQAVATRDREHLITDVMAANMRDPVAA